MHSTSFRSFAPIFLCLGLAACGPTPSSTPTGDAAVTTDAGSPGSAACARIRALNCPSAASCMNALDPAAVGVPAACRAQWSSFVTCLDANAAALTCAMGMGGLPPACMPLFTAAETCGRMAQDSGTAPGDASDASSTSDAAGPSLPAPSSGDWMADVSYALSGGNLMDTQVGMGPAFLAPGATGAPAGAYTLSFRWENFLGSVGGTADCRIGLIYNSANASYTFSNNNLLTTPCVVMAMGEAATTLTFTGARVARNALGDLSVSIDVTGAGPRYSGSGRLELTWP